MFADKIPLEPTWNVLAMLLYIWLSLGCLFLIFEMFTLGFFLFFIGLAALFVAATLFFFNLPLMSQTLLFLFLSVSFVICFRHLFVKKSKSIETMGTSPVGEWGIAFDDLESGKIGRVIIRDTIWNATCKTPVKKGTSVQVIAKKNLTLEVV